MKLAILAQTYLFDKTASINGTLVQLHNLSKAFAQKGIEVHYICSTKDKKKPSKEIKNSIHFHWIQTQSGIQEWKRQMSLYKEILEKVQPDSIYVRGRNVLQYIAGNYAKSHKSNFVWGTNGEDSAELWKNCRRLLASKKNIIRRAGLLPLKLYEDYYINSGMKMADFVVNQTKNQKEFTRKTLRKKGIILPSFFLPTENSLQKKNQILWLATLSSNKQPEIFIELLQDLRFMNWKGILGGGTTNLNYENAIREKSKNLPIEITGNIEFENSFFYYQRARLYINTSRPDSDGLPNAYIQSWLSGTPILSLHHDPNNWLMEQNIGYCAQGSVKRLKTKLQELIENPEEIEKMGKRAKNFAEEHFSNNRTIVAYINLFKVTKD